MTEFAEFVRTVGPKPYRELIQHHLKRQSTRQLQEGVAGTVEFLPAAAQGHVIEFIDAVNERMAYDQHFWKHADVKTAFGYVIQEAIKTLNIGQWMLAERDAYKTENHELAFNLFQIATLSFAYSASTDKKQRKFLGIRKGMFG